jgi:hypothetical protein
MVQRSLPIANFANGALEHTLQTVVKLFVNNAQIGKFLTKIVQSALRVKVIHHALVVGGVTRKREGVIVLNKI